MEWLIEPLSEAVARSPENVYARFELANALASAERFEDALAELDRVVALDPDYERGAAWYNRGNVLRSLGRLEQAVDSYDEALARPFEDAFAAATNKALVLDDLGRTSDAEDARKLAHDLGAEEGEALLARGSEHFSKGEHAQAIAFYRESIARNWAGAYVALLNGAISNFHLEHIDAALEWVDESLLRKPDWAPALFHRALFLTTAKRAAEALPTFEHLLAIEPTGLTHFNRACAFAQLGRNDDAVADLARALELSPELRADLEGEADFEGLRSDPRFRALVTG